MRYTAGDLMSELYNVVFEYTAAAGAYKGVRTWASFMGEDAFDKFPKRDLEMVLAQGVTEECAIEMVGDTPIKAYVGAALVESKGEDGLLNRDVLHMELGTKLYAIMTARNVSPNLDVVDGLVNYVCASSDARRMYADPEALHRVQEKVTGIIRMGIPFFKLKPTDVDYVVIP